MLGGDREYVFEQVPGEILMQVVCCSHRDYQSLHDFKALMREMYVQGRNRCHSTLLVYLKSKDADT